VEIHKSFQRPLIGYMMCSNWNIIKIHPSVLICYPYLYCTTCPILNVAIGTSKRTQITISNLISSSHPSWQICSFANSWYKLLILVSTYWKSLPITHKQHPYCLYGVYNHQFPIKIVEKGRKVETQCYYSYDTNIIRHMTNDLYLSNI
jgi:hypothetical protein